MEMTSWTFDQLITGTFLLQIVSRNLKTTSKNLLPGKHSTENFFGTFQNTIETFLEQV